VLHDDDDSTAPLNEVLRRVLHVGGERRHRIQKQHDANPSREIDRKDGADLRGDSCVDVQRTDRRRVEVRCWQPSVGSRVQEDFAPDRIDDGTAAPDSTATDSTATDSATDSDSTATDPTATVTVTAATVTATAGSTIF